MWGWQIIFHKMRVQRYILILSNTLPQIVKSEASLKFFTTNLPWLLWIGLWNLPWFKDRYDLIWVRGSVDLFGRFMKYLFLDFSRTLTSSSLQLLNWENVIESRVFVTYLLKTLFFSVISRLIIAHIFRFPIMMSRIASVKISTYLSTSTFSSILNQSRNLLHTGWN